jgi:hypothetical protein
MRNAKDAGPIEQCASRSASPGDGGLVASRIVLACLLSASLLAGQTASISPSVENAYVDKTGHVQVVRGDGKDVQIPGEKDQVSADSPVVAPDRQTVGWLVEMPNCCTSYPIPTTLVIYRSGRVVQRIGDGMMIYKWVFLDRGRRCAVSSGTVHGMTGIHLTLYDSRTGKTLRTWNGDDGEVPPKWGTEVSR